MNDTSFCPICNGIMLSEPKLGYTIKSCFKKLDHTFKIHVDQITYNVYRIWLLPNKSIPVAIYWTFPNQHELAHSFPSFISKKGHCFVERHSNFDWNNSTKTIIPFFIPDFSDYKKLKNKINTYITFM